MNAEVAIAKKPAMINKAMSVKGKSHVLAKKLLAKGKPMPKLGKPKAKVFAKDRPSIEGLMPAVRGPALPPHRTSSRGSSLDSAHSLEKEAAGLPEGTNSPVPREEAEAAPESPAAASKPVGLSQPAESPPETVTTPSSIPTLPKVSENVDSTAPDATVTRDTSPIPRMVLSPPSEPTQSPVESTAALPSPEISAGHMTEASQLQGTVETLSKEASDPGPLHQVLEQPSTAAVGGDLTLTETAVDVRDDTEHLSHEERKESPPLPALKTEGLPQTELEKPFVTSAVSEKESPAADPDSTHVIRSPSEELAKEGSRTVTKTPAADGELPKVESRTALSTEDDTTNRLTQSGQQQAASSADRQPSAAAVIGRDDDETAVVTTSDSNVRANDDSEALLEAPLLVVRPDEPKPSPSEAATTEDKAGSIEADSPPAVAATPTASEPALVVTETETSSPSTAIGEAETAVPPVVVAESVSVEVVDSTAPEPVPPPDASRSPEEPVASRVGPVAEHAVPSKTAVPLVAKEAAPEADEPRLTTTRQEEETPQHEEPLKPVVPAGGANAEESKADVENETGATVAATEEAPLASEKMTEGPEIAVIGGLEAAQTEGAKAAKTEGAKEAETGGTQAVNTEGTKAADIEATKEAEPERTKAAELDEPRAAETEETKAAEIEVRVVVAENQTAIRCDEVKEVVVADGLQDAPALLEEPKTDESDERLESTIARTEAVVSTGDGLAREGADKRSDPAKASSASSDANGDRELDVESPRGALLAPPTHPGEESLGSERLSIDVLEDLSIQSGNADVSSSNCGMDAGEEEQPAEVPKISAPSAESEVRGGSGAEGEVTTAASLPEQATLEIQDVSTKMFTIGSKETTEGAATDGSRLHSGADASCNVNGDSEEYVALVAAKDTAINMDIVEELHEHVSGLRGNSASSEGSWSFGHNKRAAADAKQMPAYDFDSLVTAYEPSRRCSAARSEGAIVEPMPILSAADDPRPLRDDGSLSPLTDAQPTSEATFSADDGRVRRSAHRQEHSDMTAESESGEYSAELYSPMDVDVRKKVEQVTHEAVQHGTSDGLVGNQILDALASGLPASSRHGGDDESREAKHKRHDPDLIIRDEGSNRAQEVEELSPEESTDDDDSTRDTSIAVVINLSSASAAAAQNFEKMAVVRSTADAFSSLGLQMQKLNSNYGQGLPVKELVMEEELVVEDEPEVEADEEADVYLVREASSHRPLVRQTSTSPLLPPLSHTPLGTPLLQAADSQQIQAHGTEQPQVNIIQPFAMKTVREGAPTMQDIYSIMQESVPPSIQSSIVAQEVTPAQPDMLEREFTQATMIPGAYSQVTQDFGRPVSPSGQAIGDINAAPPNFIAHLPATPVQHPLPELTTQHFVSRESPHSPSAALLSPNIPDAPTSGFARQTYSEYAHGGSVQQVQQSFYCAPSSDGPARSGSPPFAGAVSHRTEAPTPGLQASLSGGAIVNVQRNAVAGSSSPAGPPSPGSLADVYRIERPSQVGMRPSSPAPAAYSAWAAHSSLGQTTTIRSPPTTQIPSSPATRVAETATSALSEGRSAVLVQQASHTMQRSQLSAWAPTEVLYSNQLPRASEHRSGGFVDQRPAAERATSALGTMADLGRENIFLSEKPVDSIVTSSVSKRESSRLATFGRASLANECDAWSRQETRIDRESGEAQSIPPLPSVKLSALDAGRRALTHRVYTKHEEPLQRSRPLPSPLQPVSSTSLETPRRAPRSLSERGVRTADLRQMQPTQWTKDNVTQVQRVSVNQQAYASYSPTAFAPQFVSVPQKGQESSGPRYPQHPVVRDSRPTKKYWPEGPYTAPSKHRTSSEVMQSPLDRHMISLSPPTTGAFSHQYTAVTPPLVHSESTSVADWRSTPMMMHEGSPDQFAPGRMPSATTPQLLSSTGAFSRTVLPMPRSNAELPHPMQSSNQTDHLRIQTAQLTREHQSRHLAAYAAPAPLRRSWAETPTRTITTAAEFNSASKVQMSHSTSVKRPHVPKLSVASQMWTIQSRSGGSTSSKKTSSDARGDDEPPTTESQHASAAKSQHFRSQPLQRPVDAAPPSDVPQAAPAESVRASESAGAAEQASSSDTAIDAVKAVEPATKECAQLPSLECIEREVPTIINAEGEVTPSSHSTSTRKLIESAVTQTTSAEKDEPALASKEEQLTETPVKSEGFESEKQMRISQAVQTATFTQTAQATQTTDRSAPKPQPSQEMRTVHTTHAAFPVQKVQPTMSSSVLQSVQRPYFVRPTGPEPAHQVSATAKQSTTQQSAIQIGSAFPGPRLSTLSPKSAFEGHIASGASTRSLLAFVAASQASGAVSAETSGKSKGQKPRTVSMARETSSSSRQLRSGGATKRTRSVPSASKTGRSHFQRICDDVLRVTQGGFPWIATLLDCDCTCTRA